MLQKFLILFKLGYPSFWKKNNNLFEKILIFILLPFSFIYLLIFKINQKIRKTNKVGVPVICVGNINVGGSGKTPFVIYLIKLFKEKKINAHIVSRGYLGKINGPTKVNVKKHTVKDVGDEALLLAKKTDTWISKNKFEGALMATLNGAEVVILDDGLQNKTLHQDLKIIITDGTFGFGNGFLIPSGPLRENIQSRINKSDLMIIFNKDKYLIEKKIKNKISIIHANSEIKNFNYINNKKIIAFSGIGRPEKFYYSLIKKKLNIIKFFPFPDHYLYKKKEINKLINYAKKEKSVLVSTFKDKQRINIAQREKIFFVDQKVKLKKKEKLINILKKKKIV